MGIRGKLYSCNIICIIEVHIPLYIYIHIVLFQCITETRSLILWEGYICNETVNNCETKNLVPFQRWSNLEFYCINFVIQNEMQPCANLSIGVISLITKL